MEKINYLPQMLSIYKDSWNNQPQHFHLGYNVNKFVNIYNPYNYTSGIYFIEDFYIGKSKNLNNRIAEHAFNILKIGLTDKFNHDMYLRILEILQYRKLEVSILDSDVQNEKYHIIQNKDYYNLYNKQYNK